MRFFRCLLPVLAMLLIAGCASNTRQDSLEQTLTAYQSTIRWGSFERGLDFVAPDTRQAHPLTSLERARYQQVRVVDYDAGQGPMPTADGEVAQTVRIGLVNEHTQRERSILDHQVWKWDAKASRWWLMSGLPKITPAPAADAD